MGLIILIIYVFCGDKANYYLKYHILNTRAEIYGDTSDYIFSRILWAVALGWATIPFAIIHKLIFNKGD